MAAADLPVRCALKVDVDTHDGMRDGVPRLLDLFRSRSLRASFFLSFGPDNAGKAVWNVFRQKHFLRKMLRTNAPRLYGWRTIFSGTLLPARMVALRFPDIARRIEAEGHEVAVHCWDHRLWQDRLDRLDEAAIREAYQRAFDAYHSVFRRPPSAAGAPAWRQSAAALAAQDAFHLDYASDMRGGQPIYPALDGYQSTTLQVPTTQPCLEELITAGGGEADSWPDLVLAVDPRVSAPVIPWHAEVEGGVHFPFAKQLLDAVAARGWRVERLDSLALDARAAGKPPPPRVKAGLREIPGRAGTVFGPVAD